MKWQEVAADWPAFQEAILTRWPEADPDEVAAIDGDRARFNAYLGQLEGVTPREAEEAIDEWLAGPMPADVVMDDHLDNLNIRRSRAHIPPGEDVYADDQAFGDEIDTSAPREEGIGDEAKTEPPIGRTK